MGNGGSTNMDGDMYFARYYDEFISEETALAMFNSI
jgi:hypothetical protein